jgi:hypothetical protein
VKIAGVGDHHGHVFELVERAPGHRRSPRVRAARGAVAKERIVTDRAADKATGVADPEVRMARRKGM